MEKKTIKFWTKQEDKLLKQAITKCPNVWEAAKSLENKLEDRTFNSIQYRMYTKFSKKGVRKPALIETKGLTLPSGFSFDFTPRRVVMHKEKVEIYW